jgi:serine/threonine-protein kinase HipA
MARTSTTALAVWINGQRIGVWDQPRASAQAFTYDAEWIRSEFARPLSLSLPLLPEGEAHRGKAVESYFENLLPDNQAIRRRIRERVGARSTLAFDLLAEIGRDCVGAAQLLPVGMEPANLRRIDATPLAEADVAQVLRNVPVVPGPGHRVTGEFRISIAGAQEKTALLWNDGSWCQPHGSTPTTHIFKLPLGKVGNKQSDLSTSVENEWLCSRLVAAFGIPVARTDVARFEDQKVLVVERFDRKLSTEGRWWLRLPQEDLCQAFGLPPDRKYEVDGGPGVPRIMELLQRSTKPERDRHDFFKAQVVFWLLAATDGHAKNFSLHLNAGGAYEMTPLYDVLSTHPIIGTGTNQLNWHDVDLAMAVVSKNRHYVMRDIMARHWEAMARRCGIDGRALLEEVVAQTDQAIETAARDLPENFPGAVADSILGGVADAGQRLRSQLTS